MSTFTPAQEGRTNRLVDVHGAATILDCSARHVQRLWRSGNLPAPLRLGRLRRWGRSALEAWIARRTDDPAQAILDDAVAALRAGNRPRARSLLAQLRDEHDLALRLES